MCTLVLNICVLGACVPFAEIWFMPGHLELQGRVISGRDELAISVVGMNAIWGTAIIPFYPSIYLRNINKSCSGAPASFFHQCIIRFGNIFLWWPEAPCKIYVWRFSILIQWHSYMWVKELVCFVEAEDIWHPTLYLHIYTSVPKCFWRQLHFWLKTPFPSAAFCW